MSVHPPSHARWPVKTICRLAQEVYTVRAASWYRTPSEVSLHRALHPFVTPEDSARPAQARTTPNAAAKSAARPLICTVPALFFDDVGAEPPLVALEPAVPELPAGAVLEGTATPVTLPENGPGAAVANAFTPESAGTGGATDALAASATKSEYVLFPVCGGLMALYTACQQRARAGCK